jgi:HEAT repeat protein
MKRLLGLLLVFFGAPTVSRAFIDSTPSLGKLIAESEHVVVLRVDKVSRDRQAVAFDKVADLKGKDFPEAVKHKIPDGTPPRVTHALLDWAEPGATAVCFRRGNVCLTCIGRAWYECSAGDAPWWTLTKAKPELSYAYSGSPFRLRDHVTAILDGREVVITALKYEVIKPGQYPERKPEAWHTYEAVGSGRLMRGKEWPVWRIRANLKMPAMTLAVVNDPRSIVGDGAGGPDDVPVLVKALKQEDGGLRAEAAEDLGLIGPAAADAVGALLRLDENDPDPLVRLAAARAVALIDPRNDKALPRLVAALKDDTGKVRRRAAECLGDLGLAAASAVGDLVKAVKDTDPSVCWAAIDALGQIGPGAEEAVPVLVEALKDATVRGAAVEALGQVGRKARDAVPALERVLAGDDVPVRWAAAASLVRIGGPGVKAGVRYFLKTASPDGGKELYDAENVLVAPTAHEALREILDAVREPALRDTAVRIVRDKNFVRLTKEQLADVRKFVDDPDPGVRCVAAWVENCGRRLAGENVDYKEVIAVQAETLKAADPWARRQAARFIGSFGPYGKDGAAALTAALEDRDEGVREEAARALKAVQPK